VTQPSGADAADRAASDRPIFIVGSNGSGSTLLRLMLDSHPSIAIPEETGFLRLAMAHEWVPYWRLGDTWYRSLGLSEDQMYAEVAGFYSRLFSAYAASRGKARWGDKTPFHVWHLELAQRLYPNATVVGITRHPAAVVTSLRRRFLRPTAASMRHWIRSNRQLLYDAERLGESCVLLRYEDLVTDPETVMRALLDRLGEPWSDAVLAHHEVQPAAESTGFTRTDRAVDPGRVSEWEAFLPSRVRATVAQRTAPWAGFLGYDPARPTPVGPLGDGGSPLLPGSALAARKAAHPDVVWDPPRRVPETMPLRPPAPRRRRRARPNLDEVTIRDIVRHRLSGRMPDDARRKANEVRRKNTAVDRLIGPK
jgi:hypothetical protein